MKKTRNNRGFTLVELIIAVAILAIAISPLIANFIQSSKMNLKGRKQLNEMNLAQDIMEGLGGYTAEQVDEYLKACAADTNKELAGTLLPAGASHEGVVVVSGDNPVLKYEIEDVETVGTNHNKYKVEIIMDSTGDDQKEFNNQEVVNMDKINQYYDAVFTIPEQDIEEAAMELRGMSTNANFVDEYYDNLVRTTTIKIENSGTETNPNFKIGVYREYKLTGASLTMLGNSATDSVVCFTENISRMDSDKLPENVYIYFNGIRNASYNDSPKRENFVVENTTGEEVTVYLLRTQKAKLDGTVSQTEIDYGKQFGCRVDVVSKDMLGNVTEDVHIVSNLRYDLNATSPKYNFRTTDENGAEITDEIPLDDAGNVMDKNLSTYKRSRADYYYNGTLVQESLYQSNFSEGYQREDKNTIYKVTINLYDPQTDEKVATYDGGISN